MKNQQTRGTEYSDFDIKKTLNKYYSVIVCLGLGISVTSFVLSFVIPDPMWKTIFQVVGSLMAGAVVSGILQVKLLGDFNKHDVKIAIRPDLHNLEEVLLDEIKGIGPEVTQKTIESVDVIKDKVSLAAEFMEKGIAVLSGANLTGIVNIFPNRYEQVSGTTVIDEISKEILEETSTISIMGISLGDFFLDRGQLNKDFMRVIDQPRTSDCPRNYRALIVEPQCPELHERARWEAGEDYFEDPVFFDSTTYIETDGAARIARRLCLRRKTIEVRTYRRQNRKNRPSPPRRSNPPK